MVLLVQLQNVFPQISFEIFVLITFWGVRCLVITFRKQHIIDSLTADILMGVFYIEYLSAPDVYYCKSCLIPLTTRLYLISRRFTGLTGPASLYHKVVNVILGDVKEKMLITGRHFTRDVHCKKCQTLLGWFYEYACSPAHLYKEGNTILEDNLITELQSF
ncbi:hypothetical protein GJ496_001731 [Pomphorhynchus laevis]|nr:hypothetical protein GJ496_001731 [Pomphorhynchus laevis]